MKNLILTMAAAAAFAAHADRSLNRDAAERLFVSKESLTPRTVYVAGESATVTTRPFATTTVRASAPREEDAETTTELVSAGTRNYDVFFPDDENTRTLLPISLRVDVGGARPYVSTNRIDALPAFVHVREPSPDVVVITVERVR